MGLFAISRRFRDTRRQTVILLCVWSVSVVGLLGSRTRLAPTTPSGSTSGADLLNQFPPPPDSFVQGSLFFEEPNGAQSSASASIKTAVSPAESGYDFSEGSDRRLIERIEHSQINAYTDAAAAYARECAARPNDGLLALERVRFIQRFAYSEDFTIKSAAADYEKARAELLARFPSLPTTLLFVLEESWGEEFESKANRTAPLVHSWSPVDAARYHLLRAQHSGSNPADALRHAKDSFSLQPTVEAGLLLARSLREDTRGPEALEILGHAIFASGEPWEKRQRMDLLFDLKDASAAKEAFDELNTSGPDLIRDIETAMRLAENGYVEEARTAIGRVPENTWGVVQHTRARFDFEMKFGTAEEAEKAYREMRTAGIQNDAFGRERIALLRKHPGAGWALADFGGLALLGLLLVTAGLSPLCILVPIHYWSLRRQRAGRAATWTITS